MIIWEPIHGDVDSAVLALFVAAKLLVPGVIEFSRLPPVRPRPHESCITSVRDQRPSAGTKLTVNRARQIVLSKDRKNYVKIVSESARSVRSVNARLHSLQNVEKNAIPAVREVGG